MNNPMKPFTPLQSAIRADALRSVDVVNRELRRQNRQEVSMPRKTYTVIYRTGGTHRCSWHRTLHRFEQRADAQALAADLERAGYKALVHDTALLNSIGLPEGWEPGAEYEVSKEVRS